MSERGPGHESIAAVTVGARQAAAGSPSVSQMSTSAP